MASEDVTVSVEVNDIEYDIDVRVTWGSAGGWEEGPTGCEVEIDWPKDFPSEAKTAELISKVEDRAIIAAENSEWLRYDDAHSY